MIIAIKNRRVDLSVAWSRIKCQVVKSGDCLVFNGHRDKDGYGLLTIGDKTYRTHRLSFAFHNSRLDSSLLVCHHCDNRACVSPVHLYQGTNRDNATDRVIRGRSARNKNPNFGVDNGRAILPRLGSACVRALFVGNGCMVVQTADYLNVSASTLSRYLRKYAIATIHGRGGTTPRTWTLLPEST